MSVYSITLPVCNNFILKMFSILRPKKKIDLLHIMAVSFYPISLFY